MAKMNKSQKLWTTGFLGVTALALGLEVWASFDDSDSTIPWTGLITEYVPEEITMLALSGASGWVLYHFYKRYKEKREDGQSKDPDWGINPKDHDDD